MDWRIFFITFGSIFLAELGDKTQLANLCLSAKSKCWYAVFIGSILAFSLVTIISVFLGKVIQQYISSEYIKIISGCLFILFGILFIFGKL